MLLARKLLMGSSSPPVEISYTGGAYVTSSTGNKTFTGINAGAADPGRILLAFICDVTVNGGSGSIDVTIGGVAATLVATSTFGTDKESLWAAYVPTGTTADVYVHRTASVNRTNVALFRALNLQSFTFVDGGATYATGGTATVASLQQETGGVVLAAGYTQNGGTHTFSIGPTDASLGSTQVTSFAHKAVAAAVTQDESFFWSTTAAVGKTLMVSLR